MFVPLLTRKRPHMAENCAPCAYAHLQDAYQTLGYCAALKAPACRIRPVHIHGMRPPHFDDPSRPQPVICIYQRQSNSSAMQLTAAGSSPCRMLVMDVQASAPTPGALPALNIVVHRCVHCCSARGPKQVKGSDSRAQMEGQSAGAQAGAKHGPAEAQPLGPAGSVRSQSPKL